MSQITRFVGLDVHKSSISIAVAEAGRKEPKFLGRLPNDFPCLLKKLLRLAPVEKLLCAYEAGPTGFGLQRELTKHGIQCQVIAPSRTPKRSGDRVKTDKRDSRTLAHYLRSGDLTSIYVPDEACEAMRDLIRARHDAKRDQLKARQRLGHFLLRHDRRFSGAGNWTRRHLEWLRQQVFDHEAQNRVLEEYLQSVEEAGSRVERYEKLLEKLAPATEQGALIEALQAFRGIRLLTASAIAYELGDLKRFASPTKLMGFLGVVPSEDSSGNKVQRGAITKSGNTGLRRLLVESAWSYRFRPSVTGRLRTRAARVAPGVRQIAWKAQVRLHSRYKTMLARKKKQQKVLVALARELAGFVWAVGQERELLAS